MPLLALYFLGPPRIEYAGQLIEPDTRKATALLAYLALTGERQSRDALSALLWPEYDEQRGRAALRRTLSTLKSITGAALWHTNRDIIGLEPGQFICDVHQFRHYLKEQKWDAAASLYRDDFLTGFSLRDSIPFDDWQLLQAQTLKRELEHCLETLVQQLTQHQQGEAALSYAHRWLQLDPLREEAHRHLMQIYAQQGRREAALRQYQTCVTILNEELGVSPLAETTALAQTIESNLFVTTSPPPAPVLVLIPPAIPLVGRAGALATLQQALTQVGPDGYFLAISGEAGIGKTRLVETFLSATTNPIITITCHEGEKHLAYAPFVQALQVALAWPTAENILASCHPTVLAEAARLLPELGARFPHLPAVPSDGPGAQVRFFTGVGQLLTQLMTIPQPGIFFLDDAHWADSASLELLAYLVRRLEQRPLLILVAWRDEEIQPDHALVRLLTETRRSGHGDQIQLQRFTPEEVTQLLQNSGLPLTLAERLYAESEGLPYFAAAYLTNLTEQNRTNSIWNLPVSVLDLWHSRLLRVSETGRQLLQTAAAIGRGFGFDLVQTVSGRGEDEAVMGLDELVARGLLLEQNGPTYDFSHHKLRDLVYETMSLVRRRLLHRRLAERLEQQGKRLAQPFLLAGQIARHYQLAGQNEDAAAYYVQAGDYTRTLFAHRESLAHYQAALALRHPDAAKLQETCGDLHIRLGQYGAALRAYEQASTQAPLADLPRLEHKVGQVYLRRGEWELALHRFELAEQGWGNGAAASQLYLDWSYTVYRQGDIAAASRLAQSAQQQATDALAQANSYNILGILARRQGNSQEAHTHFQASRELSQQHNLLDAHIAALNNLALLAAAAGNYGEGQSLLETALNLCLTWGDRHWQAALHNNLADLFHRIGQEEGAMAQLKQSVTIYAELGRDGEMWQPEVWKLTEW
ncbi:MAG: AAA family ATPase [Chloroflexi bacterium]|nr:AAA family ATPase [Chloroflexota bacterium]MBP8057803.1 AAA family ATPase [Chloroflexota bacterium]